MSTNALAPAASAFFYLIRSPHYPTNGSAALYELNDGGWNLLYAVETPAATFDEFMIALTNGAWTIEFTSATITNLDTNLLAPAVILWPTNGSVNVPTNPPFIWTGPSGVSGVFAEKYELPYQNVGC